MRKALWVAALLAVAIAASPASAVVYSDAGTLPSGSYIAKYENYSDLYWAAGTTAGQNGQGSTASSNGLPLDYQNATSAFATAVTTYQTALAAGAANASYAPGTLENRAIFNAGEINSVTTGGTVWNGSSQQLSGLFYNLTLAGATVTRNAGGQEIITLDFVPNTRTTPLNVSSLPAGSGGVLQIYSSSAAASTSFTNSNVPDPNGVGTFTPATLGTSISSVNGGTIVNNGTGTWGPSSWVEGTAGTSDSDTYADVSVGTLWLSAAFVPFSDVGLTAADGSGATVFEETLNLATGVGSAEGDLDVTGGTDASNIALGGIATAGIPVDMTMTSVESTPANDGTDLYPSTGSYYGTGYWPVDSNDPVRLDVTVIPEPATLSLLGFGIAGLLARCRKK